MAVLEPEAPLKLKKKKVQVNFKHASLNLRPKLRIIYTLYTVRTTLDPKNMFAHCQTGLHLSVHAQLLYAGQ